MLPGSKDYLEVIAMGVYILQSERGAKPNHVKPRKANIDLGVNLKPSQSESNKKN